MNTELHKVVEAHRLAVGATSVHVDFEENATPEGLASDLALARHQVALFEAFRLEERLEAQVLRLRGLLRNVDRLARQGDTGAILRLVDLVPQVVVVEDLHAMAAARVRRGELLPEGVKDFLEVHPLRA